VLVVPFVAQISVAVGLTGYLSFTHGQRAVEGLVQRLAEDVAHRIEQNLSNYLETPVQVTKSNAVAIQLGILNWQDTSTIKQYFQHQFSVLEQTNEALNSIGLMDRQENFLSVSKTNQGEQLLRRRDRTTNFRVDTFLIQTPDPIHPTPAQIPHSPKPSSKAPLPQNFNFQKNSPTTPTSKPSNPVLNQATPSLQRVSSIPYHSEANRAFWQKINQSQTGFWHLGLKSIPMQSPTLVAVYSQPFYNRANQFQGTVCASIALSQIGQFLDDLKIGRSGQAFLVDRQGFLIATSTGEPLFGRNATDFNLIHSPVPHIGLNSVSEQYSLKAVKSLNSVTNETARLLVETYGDFANIRDRQQLTLTTRGKRYFVHVRPFRSDSTLDWLSIVVIPEADFSAEIDRNYQTLVLLCMVALVSAIALGLLTARRIIRPIQRLSQASQNLMLGKQDNAVEEHSRIVELAVLAHTFNEMTEHLNQSFDQVRQALQESKEKFRTLFRTCPDPISLTSFPEGRYLEVNDSLLKLLEYSREELINHTTKQLGVWLSQEERQNFLQIIQQNGRAYNVELNGRTRSGKILTVLMSAELIELEGRTCLLSVARDITERKQLEKALQEGEQKLQEIIDEVPAYIAYLDKELCYRLVNKAYEERFNQPRDWFYGRHIREVLGETNYQSIQHHLENALMGNSVTYTVERFTSDGKMFAFEVVLTPDLGADGQVKGCHSLLIDITARKQADDVLRLSEQRFRSAFDNAAIGMNIAALDGQYLKVNSALCQMFKYTEAELLQIKSQDITHPDDRERNQELLNQVLNGEISHFQFEKRYLRKDGEIVWALLTNSLVRDAQNQPLYFVNQVQDISTRKFAESILNLN
jgi:PAS domain S-box-containing protein